MVLIILGIVLAIVFAYFHKKLGNTTTISEGIHISGMDVGNKTEEEAQDMIDEYVDRIANKNITVDVNGKSVVVTFGAVGFSYEEENLAKKAFEVSKKGSALERLSEISKAKDRDYNFDLKFSINEDTLTSFIKDGLKKYNKRARNSELQYDATTKQFSATKEKTGVKVDIDATFKEFNKALTDSLYDDSDMELTATCKVSNPKYTSEDMMECTDLIGSFSTYYGTSTAERATNVEVAASRINGITLYPGDVFSVNDTILDRTEENGYKTAAEYVSGKVVDGIGGGVCQVATTLYNAVLNAELTVVERKPHQMVVSYVPLSRDAAIAGDYQDFKFENSLDYPIYLQSSVGGGYLAFSIYGKETRASNRKIEFEPETVETIQPGEPVEEVDTSMPAGYRATTQAAHTGYKAKLWKIVYEDGVETDRVEVNTSTYNASPEYITVGPSVAEATDSPESTASPDETAKPQATAKASNSTETNSTATANSSGNTGTTGTTGTTETTETE